MMRGWHHADLTEDLGPYLPPYRHGGVIASYELPNSAVILLRWEVPG